jgi:hypothetical protein
MFPNRFDPLEMIAGPVVIVIAALASHFANGMVRQ